MAGTLAIEQGKEVVAADWDASTEQWVLEVSESEVELSPQQPRQASTLAVGHVWCAMGSQRGIGSNPLLSQLQAWPLHTTSGSKDVLQGIAAEAWPWTMVKEV